MRTDKCSMCHKTVKLATHRYCLDCRNYYMREWRKTHPLNDEQRKKLNTRSYAKEYLKRGKLNKLPCQVCGSEKSQMHHLNYDQPLNVRWLCRTDHLDLHKFINQVTGQI